MDLMYSVADADLWEEQTTLISLTFISYIILYLIPNGICLIIMIVFSSGWFQI